MAGRKLEKAGRLGNLPSLDCSEKPHVRRGFNAWRTPHEKGMADSPQKTKTKPISWTCPQTNVHYLRMFKIIEHGKIMNTQPLHRRKPRRICCASCAEPRKVQRQTNNSSAIFHDIFRDENTNMPKTC